MPLTLDMFRKAHDVQPGHLPPDVVECVLSCFQDYVRNAGKAGRTIEEAFGASGGASGCDPWYIKLAMERRNLALRELAAAILPGKSTSKQADAVLLAISVYRPTWNRRDQFKGAPATDDARTRWLFSAFREASLACTDFPQSPSHMRAVLSE